MSAKIEVSFDPSSPEQLVALHNFLSVVGGGKALTLATQEEVVQEVQEEVKENVFAKKNKANKAKKEKTAPPVSEKETTEEEAQDDDVTIEDIRKLVSLKAKDYRKEIKDKLTEMEADNVTALDKSHYVDFHTFLTGLE